MVTNPNLQGRWIHGDFRCNSSSPVRCLVSGLTFFFPVQPPAQDSLPPPSVLKRVSKHHLKRIRSHQFSSALNTAQLSAAYSATISGSDDVVDPGGGQRRPSPCLLSVAPSVQLELDTGVCGNSRFDSSNFAGASETDDSMPRSLEYSRMILIDGAEPALTMARAYSVGCDFVIAPSPITAVLSTNSDQRRAAFDEPRREEEEGRGERGEIEEEEEEVSCCLVCCESVADAVQTLPTSAECQQPCTGHPHVRACVRAYARAYVCVRVHMCLSGGEEARPRAFSLARSRARTHRMRRAHPLRGSQGALHGALTRASCVRAGCAPSGGGGGGLRRWCSSAATASSASPAPPGGPPARPPTRPPYPATTQPATPPLLTAGPVRCARHGVGGMVHVRERWGSARRRSTAKPEAGAAGGCGLLDPRGSGRRVCGGGGVGGGAAWGAACSICAKGPCPARPGPPRGRLRAPVPGRRKHVVGPAAAGVGCDGVGGRRQGPRARRVLAPPRAHRARSHT